MADTELLLTSMAESLERIANSLERLSKESPEKPQNGKPRIWGGVYQEGGKHYFKPGTKINIPLLKNTFITYDGERLSAYDLAFRADRQRGVDRARGRLAAGTNGFTGERWSIEDACLEPANPAMSKFSSRCKAK